MPFELTRSDRILGEMVGKFGNNPIIELVSTPGTTYRMNYEDLSGFLVIYLEIEGAIKDPIVFNIDLAIFTVISEKESIYEISQEKSKSEPFRFKVIEKGL